MSSRDLDTVKPARAWGRFWASLIDSLIVGIPSLSVPLLIYGIIGVKPTLDQLGANIWTIMWYMLVSFLYNWYYLHTKGATLGKDAYGFEVISLYPRTKVTGKGAAIREGAKIVMNQLPLFNRLFALVNGFLVLFTKQKHTLYDHLSRTQVVKARKPWSMKRQLTVFPLLTVAYLMVGVLAYMFASY